MNSNQEVRKRGGVACVIVAGSAKSSSFRYWFSLRLHSNLRALSSTKATRKVIRAWLVPQQASNKEGHKPCDILGYQTR
ncbi:hypothetical protein PC118_g21376 [Phytophthora cactorum]|uniref:Uncharacterized protein n=1 Tax=Phytophthora cactorum TaxID=29920 RepID=A0A8T1F2V9_9STRA|nr:hypothetical protein PC112_g21564 [Phytophthora cactorum]KAG2813644.1 hypothetical protein PC111_g14303 [Phytophthora cactorum]KAG2877070.1 hypothetical protein PC114_g23850 [Phytophthora cactorum]KAG2889291.1 hypothetical protein PC117_g24723 [Phytophthora cactorum]KAG2962545.1 hypothetical protein PC118_g21376 [Phytophthora cactorum]